MPKHIQLLLFMTNDMTYNFADLKPRNFTHKIEDYSLLNDQCFPRSKCEHVLQKSSDVLRHIHCINSALTAGYEAHYDTHFSE